MSSLNLGFMSLSGQVALVTGGGTGIGLMIAKGYAANGAKVYITGRRLEALKTAAADVPGLIPLQMDVTKQSSIDEAVKMIEEAEGVLDILVNNAGVTLPLASDPHWFEKQQANIDSGGDPYKSESFEGWMELLTVNTSAPFFMIRSFQDLLIKGAQARKATSCVVNISSASVPPGVWAYGFSFAYPLSKAALEKMSTGMAADFAHRKIPIRLNVIQPGLFPSQMAPPEIEKMHGVVFPGTVAPSPFSRLFGTEHEMVATATYLASSEYTNGATIRTDGGYALVNP